MKNLFGYIVLAVGGIILFSSKKLKPIFETIIYPDEFAGQGYNDNADTA